MGLARRRGRGLVRYHLAPRPFLVIYHVLCPTDRHARNGKPHEKADPAVVHRLRQILEPTRTEAEHEAELQEDEDTTWFGFGRDATGQPALHDYGRFAAIMGETFTEDAGERYPQLVSFIGETGTWAMPCAASAREGAKQTRLTESQVLGKAHSSSC